MLSEKSKSIVTASMATVRQLPHWERMAKAGPAFVVDELLEPGPDQEPVMEFITNLRENRQEAERLIAGLMGMM